MKKSNVLVEYDPGDGEISEFEIAVTKDKPDNPEITMWYYKYSDGWTTAYKGDTALTITDDGNGIIVQFPYENQSIELDYSQTYYLMLALNYYDNDSNLDRWKPKTRIFKKKKLKRRKKYGKRQVLAAKGRKVLKYS